MKVKSAAEGNKFVLLTIEEIWKKYGAITEFEGFNLYDDWNDQDFFLVTDEDISIDGNLYIDIYEDKEKEYLSYLADLQDKNINTIRIEGILINGNLAVRGCIINAEGDYGPFMYLKGNIEYPSLLTGGPYIEMEGNVSAKEIVMTHYNHGHFNCTGSVTALSVIPKAFLTNELILEVFKNSTDQADVRKVPAEFITEDFLVEYVKLGKGLWLDRACNENNISKQTVLNKAMEAGIEYVDNMFGYHFSKEVFEYASQLYNNEYYREQWDAYIKKYKNKIDRIK